MDNKQTATWLAAVAKRDAKYDGKFVYGVVTTGVFCKPSCPSRQAKPENIRLFNSNGDARLAGFRPCRRCGPEGAIPALLRELADRIVAQPEANASLGPYARRIKLSEATLRRRFKSFFGLTPRQFQSALRAKALRRALREQPTVTDAIHAAGYTTSSRVYESLETHLGMTPSRYQQGGKGEQIVYASRKTRLGRLGIGATSRGVCFVEFGSSAQEIYARIREEFPDATLTRSSAEQSPLLNAWLNALETQVAGGGESQDIPLDLRGTTFQIKVWRFLTGISVGQRVSYTDVAKGIGKPRAVRAAASACASNRIALLIPCHRVLRSDGALGGYKWGLDRKRELLDAEARAVDSKS